MEPLEKSIHQTDQAIDLVKQTIEIANRLKAEKEALRVENTRLKEALKEADDYLSQTKYENGKPIQLNLIGAGSILHKKIKAALNPKPL
jgi:regulator of replication initiation timing